MLGLRRALLALFVIGVIFAGFDVALVLSSGHESQPVVTAIIGPLIGLSFIGTGVFAWFRRPYNRFGLLMVAVGFAWFLAGLAEANGDTLFTLGSYVAPLYVAIVVHLLRKRRMGSAPQRRAQAPMLLASLTAASLMTLTALLEVGGAPKAMSDLASGLATVAFAVLPYAFLAGLVRSRYSRAGAVGELIERLNAPTSAESLRDALATALGDKGLGLVYWRESVGHYVDYDGRPVELPAPGSGRAATEVERDGRRVGAIIHDQALAEERSLVRAVAASAALALDNERLEAELRARLEELHS